MFIVRTYVGPSAIHGNGVFAAEDLKEGQVIWQFTPDLDLVVPFARIDAAPQAFRDYMQMYGYVSPQVSGGMILSCDHAKFINHSDEPNTVIDGPKTLARRAIVTGEEITCDYRICCAGFTGAF